MTNIPQRVKNEVEKMKKKIIAWSIIIVLLIGLTVLFIKMSPRKVYLTMQQDETDGTTTELRIEGWTWNFFFYYTEINNFAWEPQIKATMTITPSPHSDAEDSWTADLMTIFKFPDRDELFITYMGYDTTQNAYGNGNLWITKEGDSSYQIWVDESVNGEDVVISPVFTVQSTGLEQYFND